MSGRPFTVVSVAVSFVFGSCCCRQQRDRQAGYHKKEASADAKTSLAAASVSFVDKFHIDAFFVEMCNDDASSEGIGCQAGSVHPLGCEATTVHGSRRFSHRVKLF